MCASTVNGAAASDIPTGREFLDFAMLIQILRATNKTKTILKVIDRLADPIILVSNHAMLV